MVRFLKNIAKNTKRKIKKNKKDLRFVIRIKSSDFDRLAKNTKSFGEFLVNYLKEQVKGRKKIVKS